MNTTQAIREYFKTGQVAVAFEDDSPLAQMKQTTETGRAMGFELAVEADPNAELMDSMEELSFQFEEKQMKNIGERKLGERMAKDSAYLLAVKGWQKILPDLPGNAFMEHILRMLRSSAGLLSPRELLRQLAEGSQDPTHEFAMLEILEQALQDEGKAEAGRTDNGQATAESQRTEARGSAMMQLLAEAKQLLNNERGAEVRAGLNLAEQINSTARSPEEMQDLRNLYREQVIGFKTPQECFKSLLQTRGQGRLSDAIDFLTKGCGIDLQSPSPSQSPEELRRILTDLQCVNVLNAILDKGNQLVAKMQEQFNETCLLNGEKMTGRIMDFTEMPFISSSNIASFISSCGINALLAQLYFCTELVGMFHQLSPRLFSNDADRFKLIDAGQEHLDGLVSLEEEAEEQEKEREKRQGGR